MWLNLQLQLYTFTSPPLSLSHCPAHSTAWPTNSFSSTAPACAMEHRGEGAFSQDLGWQNIPPHLGMLFHYSIIHTVKSKGWVLQFHWPTHRCNPNFDLLGDWKALSSLQGPSFMLVHHAIFFTNSAWNYHKNAASQIPPLYLLLISITPALNRFPRFYSQMASKSLQGYAATEALPHTQPSCLWWVTGWFCTSSQNTMPEGS